MNTVLYCALNQIKSIAILLYPIMPSSIEKIFKSMSLKKDDISLKNIEKVNFLKPGNIILKSEILFKKIDSE